MCPVKLFELFEDEYYIIINKRPNEFGRAGCAEKRRFRKRKAGGHGKRNETKIDRGGVFSFLLKKF